MKFFSVEDAEGKSQVQVQEAEGCAEGEDQRQHQQVQ